MMRKYRYEVVKKVTPFRRFATLAYFLLGWNCIGLVFFGHWRNKQKAKDPTFDQLSSRAKYMRMIGVHTDNIKSITVTGFKVTDKKDITIEELLEEKKAN